MAFEDTFKGDNAALLGSIEALLDLARANALVPPVPAMPLQLLQSAAARLSTPAEESDAPDPIAMAFYDGFAVGICRQPWDDCYDWATLVARDYSAGKPLPAPPAEESSVGAALAVCTTDCFECGHALEGPWCPACNPELRPEWQPIETAPQDGTSVLLICATAYTPTAGEGWWSDGAGGPGWRHYSRPEDKWSGGVHIWFPTHWMPLPAAPAEARTGQPEGEA